MKNNISIGSKYEQTKKILSDKIRQGTISVLELKAENHACYFCTNKIIGKMKELIVIDYQKGRETESRYNIHTGCYNDAKYLETTISSLLGQD